MIFMLIHKKRKKRGRKRILHLLFQILLQIFNDKSKLFELFFPYFIDIQRPANLQQGAITPDDLIPDNSQ